MPQGAAEPHDASSLLTQREGDVLQLLRQGLSNAAIALDLQIGIETVRTHARNIYRKLGVSSRRELVALPARLPEPARPAAAHPGRHRAAPSRTAVRRRLHD